MALGADRVRKSPLTVDAVGWTIRNATWPVFPEGKLLKTKRPKTKKACGKCRIRGNPQKTRIPTRCLEKPRKNGSAFPHFPQARRLEQPKNQMHLNTYKGWTRHKEEAAKPPLMERTGWFGQEFLDHTTPAARANVASQLSLDRASC